MVALTLIVLYTEDILRLRSFYELLGLVFDREQHGRGPIHYSSILPGGLVLEIYPGIPGRNRLGFHVDELEPLLLRLEEHTIRYTLTTRGEDRVAVCKDPDGRHIELVVRGVE